MLHGRRKITLLTGAGISAASGIPTFRGEDGFWRDAKLYAGERNPEALLTYTFFKKNPMAVWEWHYDFIKLVQSKRTNAGHVAIAKFQEHCIKSQNDLDCMLIT